ncbi:hypothetical protein WDU94_010801 [Cyamophila willieti]
MSVYVRHTKYKGCQGEHITSNEWSHKCDGKNMKKKACTLSTPFRSMQMRGGYLPFEPEPVSNIKVSIITQNATSNLTTTLRKILNVNDIREDVNLSTLCKYCKSGVDLLGLNPIPILNKMGIVIDIMDDLVAEKNWQEDVETHLSKVPDTILNHKVTKRETAKSLCEILKNKMEIIRNNTKKYYTIMKNTPSNESANTKTEETAIFDELYGSFSLINVHTDNLLRDYPELVVQPLFTLCSTMNLFLPIMKDWDDNEFGLKPLYRRVVKNFRKPLTRERLDKIKVHQNYTQTITQVKDLDYNPYGYIDPNLMWNCTNLYDTRIITSYNETYELRDEYDKLKADYEYNKTIVFGTENINPGSQFKPDVYYCDPESVEENFVAYTKWVRTRFEYAYDTVCRKN